MKRNSLLLLIAVAITIASCGKGGNSPSPNPIPTPTPSGNVENDPINFGNPTNAVAQATSPENYLKDYTYFKVGYSKSRGVSSWVAWHLESADLGSAPRQNDFRPDTQLPTGWYQVSTSSYSGSGFDRGHNCPSGDRTSTVTANSTTFYMTNMTPEAPNLNQGPWAGLEDYIRNTLVGSANEAYITSGSYGVGGYNSSNALFNSIDNGNVTVPAKIWKVVVVMPKGANDLTRITRDATVLVVTMPNDNRLYTTGGTSAWRNYLTTVTNLEIEANASGIPLNLFRNIADTLKPLLKAKLFQ